MSISIGDTSAPAQMTATQATGPTRPARPAAPPVAAAAPASTGDETPAYVTAAAAALGMSVEEVTDALASGMSLTELAEQQGVAKDDLVAALVADAPDDIAATGDVQAMVERLVDRPGLGGPGGGRPPAGSSGVMGVALTDSQRSTVDALSSLLETDPASLLESLRAGTSLADLLADKSVTTDTLAGLVEDGLLIDTSA